MSPRTRVYILSSTMVTCTKSLRQTGEFLSWWSRCCYISFMGTGIDISMVLIVFTEGDNHLFLPSVLIAINGLAHCYAEFWLGEKKSVICLLALINPFSLSLLPVLIYMCYINYLNKWEKIICWLNKSVTFSEILCYSCIILKNFHGFGLN